MTQLNTTNQMIAEFERVLGPAKQPEKSITEVLAELGVTHERDANSNSTGTHRLFFAGRFIGHYDAHQVGALIREHLSA